MKEDTKQKIVSIIVPTYNRLPHLKRTIESLLQQDTPTREILIVNDGSTDGTSDYLDNLKKTKSITVIHQKNGGPARARNTGLRTAKGEIIAFTDDDCIVPPDWVSKITEVFNDKNTDFAGGYVKNMVKKNFFSELSQNIVNHMVLHFGSHNQSTHFLTSNNIAYRSHILNQAGGFDTCFRRPGGEEITLNYRLLSKGMRGRFVKNLIIEHYHIMSLRSFIRQQKNYGRGVFVMHNIVGPTLDTPPTFSLGIGLKLKLVFSWLKQNPFKGIAKGLFFVLSQALFLIGYIQESLEQRTIKKKAQNL